MPPTDRQAPPSRKLVFVSHISEEAGVADWLKETLNRDFLQIFEVFVSSDTESIDAGDDWFESVRSGLERAQVLIVLCSRASVLRPWVNFELGAAWMRGTPIVPVCHSGMTPGNLPSPLSKRQALDLRDPDGLERLYRRLASEFECGVPSRDFAELAHEVPSAPEAGMVLPGLDDDQQVARRLRRALEGKFNWRSLERAAIEAGVSEEAAARVLRADDEVLFGQGKSGNLIVGLKSRVR
jgi:hypothetical protein